MLTRFLPPPAGVQLGRHNLLYGCDFTSQKALHRKTQYHAFNASSRGRYLEYACTALRLWSTQDSR